VGIKVGRRKVGKKHEKREKIRQEDWTQSRERVEEKKE
jgi:hypothetical protein